MVFAERRKCIFATIARAFIPAVRGNRLPNSKFSNRQAQPLSKTDSVRSVCTNEALTIEHERSNIEDEENCISQCRRK